MIVVIFDKLKDLGFWSYKCQLVGYVLHNRIRCDSALGIQGTEWRKNIEK